MYNSKILLKVLTKINNIKKYIKIKLNDFDGFEFVREDRGALEYVAKSEKVWLEYEHEIKLPIAAFSAFDSIYWPNKKAMEDIKVLKHELSHIEDFKKLGYLYEVLYKLFDYKFGFANNPFEIKARSREKEFSFYVPLLSCISNPSLKIDGSFCHTCVGCGGYGSDVIGLVLQGNIVDAIKCFREFENTSLREARMEIEMLDKKIKKILEGKNA